MDASKDQLDAVAHKPIHDQIPEIALDRLQRTNSCSQFLVECRFERQSDLTTIRSQHQNGAIQPFVGPNYQHSAASYERELERHRRAELQLREIIALDENLLRQKDETIQNQALLSSESAHRLLNDLQMIKSPPSSQSRATANAEAASQLAAAADRIAMIGRSHRRLHSFEGATTVAFKKFLENLCRDLCSLVSSGQPGERDITAQGVEIKLAIDTKRPHSSPMN